jgi:nitroreductase
MSDAQPAHPIQPLFQQRWSPYRFRPDPVEEEKLLSCLEAASWAASSYNEQPWSFLVARREEGAAFEAMLSCLVEANQAWAERAGVLLLTTIRTQFRRDSKPNRVALHDLGAAAAHLALQAAALGLQAHQMAGVNLSRIRQHYAIPEGVEPQTAIAIGYVDDRPPAENDPLAERDQKPRTRRPLAEQVYAGKWGQAAGFVKG